MDRTFYILNHNLMYASSKSTAKVDHTQAQIGREDLLEDATESTSEAHRLHGG